MEKWFDLLLYDVMDVLLTGFCGCMVMEWLSEEKPEYMIPDTHHHEEMTFMLN